MEAQESEAPRGFGGYVREIRETGLVLAWIWRELVGPEGKRLMLRMGGVFVVSSLLVTLQPLVFAQVVNALGAGETQLLVLMYLALASVVISTFGAQVVQMLVRERAWNRNTFHMNSRVNELFHEKSLGQHLSQGALLSHVTIERAKSRIETIQQLVLFDVGTILVQLMFTFVLLWTLGWQIGLIASGLVVMHVTWSLYLNYHVARDAEPIEREFRAHSRQYIERWEKVGRVKTSGKSATEHARLEGWFNQILHDDLRFWSWFIKRGALRDVLVILVHLSVTGYGVYLTATGEWEVGTLIPLFSWMTAITQNLGYVGMAERRVSQHVPYIKSMKRALELPPAFIEGEGKQLTNEEPVGIRFKDVTMTYEDGSHPIFENLSLGIKPGEKVALIGPSGAGKSTVMKLLLRFSDPTSGEIWINGSKLTDLNHASWMEKVGYIPQHAEIFDGTIRYNLTFGLPEDRKRTITDEEIWEVMRSLQIDFGSRLTDGLDTLVGTSGLKLSGGQQQRLMIGAAVIKRPIFMVIDEATSSLDSTTEKLVQEGLEAVLQGPVGALIVAHRLSTVRTLCSRFIVLRPYDPAHSGESQIEAEASTFEELYERSPTFRQLADDQGIVV